MKDFWRFLPTSLNQLQIEWTTDLKQTKRTLTRCGLLNIYRYCISYLVIYSTLNTLEGLTFNSLSSNGCFILVLTKLLWSVYIIAPCIDYKNSVLIFSLIDLISFRVFFSSYKVFHLIMWNKCLLAYWKVLKLVLDKNGPSVQTLCLDALPFSLVHSLLLKLGRNSLASPLPFWKCVESRMLGICLYYFKVLQFITCPSITKSFSYMYWMEKNYSQHFERKVFGNDINWHY